jgi:hypothetical protein
LLHLSFHIGRRVGTEQYLMWKFCILWLIFISVSLWSWRLGWLEFKRPLKGSLRMFMCTLLQSLKSSKCNWYKNIMIFCDGLSSSRHLIIGKSNLQHNLLRKTSLLIKAYLVLPIRVPVTLMSINPFYLKSKP